MKSSACAELVEEYAKRSRRYGALDVQRFADEAKLVAWLAQARGKGRTLAMLFDSRGKSVSSEDLAASVEQAGVDGVQQIVFAIGPADGWSDATRRSADQLIAFGRITLPHELALAVAAEQIYRALTIVEGHPYHGGH